MPAKDDSFWKNRIASGVADPCHYEDPYTNWYAGQVRKAGIKRAWPKSLTYPAVLDVGCGDGRMSQWMILNFGATVVGTDPFLYPGVDHRVTKFVQADAEHLSSALKDWEFPLATAITSLCCMEDWQAALDQIVQLADRLLVVENTQTPTPPWKEDVPQLHHIEYNDLTVAMDRLGYSVENQTVVNILDRALMVSLPPRLLLPAMVLTWVVDRFISPLVPLPKDPLHGVFYGRYSAILFVKRGLDE